MMLIAGGCRGTRCSEHLRSKTPKTINPKPLNLQHVALIKPPKGSHLRGVVASPTRAWIGATMVCTCRVQGLLPAKAVLQSFHSPKASSKHGSDS